MEKYNNVDDFIENSMEEAKPPLIKLREMIKIAFPGVEEKIGYGVPQYKYNKSSIGMSVAKKHVTIGFDYGMITDEIRTELESKGYKLGLQTLQIKFNEEIPSVELEKLFEHIKGI